MGARELGWTPWRRCTGRVAAWAATTMTLAVLGTSPTVAATIVPRGAMVPVVVEGSADTTAGEVTRLGGVVERRLPRVDGVRARVPVGEITDLARVDGVHAVTPDGPLARGS
jgi:serine protease AprX